MSPTTASSDPLPRLAALYARLALAAAFLSAVAARFGLWGGRYDPAAFARFERLTAEVNVFLPPAAIPLVARAATAAEVLLAAALLVNRWPRAAAYGSALLLAGFATAMAVSQGIKAPLDYSVYSASAAALLLAAQARWRGPSGAGRGAR